jgi:peptidoglycan/LPS O-acetylase OafA/YrhL
MTSKFSAYLDIVRFLAALIVFLGHASTGYMTGGLFWQVAHHGDTCVVVFFALSGFVIGYVVDTKDKTWELYVSNRSARLWSVVIPALVLTFFVDYFGVRMAPTIYDGPWFQSDHLALRYLASSLMLQETWHLWLVPGINGPFWSLTYEAFYYAVFAIVFFAKSPLRWVCAAVVLIAGGPLIAALFPIWAMGYLAYWLTKRVSLSRSVGWLLFATGIVLLVFSPMIRASMQFDIPVMGDPIVGRYIDAFAIFVNLIGAHQLSQGGWTPSSKIRKRISTVASTTFVLYLFHRPLIQFFSYAGPESPASWERRLLVLGGTLAIAFIITPLTERLRTFMRKAILHLLTFSWRKAAIRATERVDLSQIAPIATDSRAVDVKPL